MWSTILLMSRLPTVDSLKATGVREIYQRLAGAGAALDRTASWHYVINDTWFVCVTDVALCEEITSRLL